MLQPTDGAADRGLTLRLLFVVAAEVPDFLAATPGQVTIGIWELPGSGPPQPLYSPAVAVGAASARQRGFFLLLHGSRPLPFQTRDQASPRPLAPPATTWHELAGQLFGREVDGSEVEREATAMIARMSKPIDRLEATDA